MPERFTKEIADRAKNIPVKILRGLLPGVKLRKKEDLARALFSQEPDKLIRLATYYTINKERSFYLLRYKNSSNKLNEQNLTKGKQVRDSEKDFIVNCSDVVSDSIKKEKYIKLKVHSSKRKYCGEDPETLEPKEIELRKGFSIFLIFHLSDQLIECRTKNSFKAEYARIAVGKLLADDAEAFERVIIPPDKQLKLDQDMRFKKATISNINFSGTSEINLKGEDVAHTIDVLKHSHNLDLRSLGNVSLLKGELSNKPIKFYPDGKVSAKTTVENPYELVRSLI